VARLADRETTVTYPLSKGGHIRRLIVTLSAAAALASPAADAHSTAAVTVDSPKWIPPLIRRLAVCESRGNPRHEVHRRSDNWHGGGIVSWYVGTWQLDRYPGMPAFPWQASLRDQVKVAVRSVRRHRDFGCLDYGWVRG